VKVVFVNRYFFPDHSATSQILSDLAFFLAERGWEVHVVTSRQRYDDAGAGLLPHEIVQRVRIHRVWTSGFGRRWLPGRAVDYLSFYLAAAWRLIALLSAGDIVVAKTDPPLISVVAAVAARMRRAKLVNWWQDVFAGCVP
jgi:colanic acid biosynthesis glycosyl transferase WcaI